MDSATAKSSDVVWHKAEVTSEERAKLKKQKPVVLWYTGLSGSGKSTVANAVDKMLFEQGRHTYVLDGDNVRHGLNNDLGFSDIDRIENIRRIGEVAKLFVDAGLIVSTAFISPFLADREMVKALLSEGQFIEVYIDTPLEVCESRDPKGLYKKARAGEIKHFTGIDSAYEAPIKADIHVETANKDVKDCAIQIVEFLAHNKYI
ncbi:adenylyl-sulfate kinase [Shewanella aestuarii]|uniref:Adenylyl-sulfate kinase n=1 Tax=Shewanella aestuarii TaxID=1028752 RepID=A0A6G9QL51_9GAMM|nr:adenylyl-sulfate kinase [Shewanella aestuarii]QIR15118.1 adenylyl-sulfate kinase [Shewanella aestuarii]